MRVNKFLIAFAVVLLCPIMAWFLHVTGNREEGSESTARAAASGPCPTGTFCGRIVRYTCGCSTADCCPTQNQLCMGTARAPSSYPCVAPPHPIAGGNCIKIEGERIYCTSYDCVGSQS